MFYIIIAIIIFEFIFSRTLDKLNSSWRNKKLPLELEDIYDAEKYLKSQEYGSVNSKFALFSSSFQLILILIMLFLGGFAYFDNIAAQYSENPVIISLLFFGILFLLSDILNIPFDIYSTFVIEEKFGFNKTTVKTFILDKIKSLLLTILIGGLILAIIVWFYYETTDMFWIYAWILISVFSIFIAMFYSNLIVPLFNKQTPLEEGELKDAINKFSQKAGFKVENIFVIDGSKRSSKANAYFTGLGKKKRIVLYDTLINDLKTNEIVAVLAHEIGHYKLKHTLYSMIFSILQTGIIFFILSLFIDNINLSKALGSDKVTFELGIIAFGILFSPISTIIGFAMNIFSRKNEYQADKFAADYEMGNNLISALKKLSANSLSNLTPHPAYIFVYYSHPSLYQRILSIKSNSLNSTIN
ncbi:MAG: M48 family metallopeptidase [Bacteroidales bacterium]|nr:M48 family metallopeptidase [Bacteroidales bacterium]